MGVQHSLFIHEARPLPFRPFTDNPDILLIQMSFIMHPQIGKKGHLTLGDQLTHLLQQVSLLFPIVLGQSE